MRPGGSSLTRRTASSTPGTKASREVASWRIVSSWPSAAEQRLLVGDEARQPHGVDRNVVPGHGADALGRGLRGARRCVELVVRVQLDDLHVREELRGLLGELHREHGAEREVGRVERGQLGGVRRGVETLARLGVEPGRAEHDGQPAAPSAASACSSPSSGRVRSTNTSAGTSASASATDP